LASKDGWGRPYNITGDAPIAPRELVAALGRGLGRRIRTPVIPEGLALRGAALWDEVNGRLHESALSLSGGQQQRVCIARAIAGEPDVLLLDEPCSALDPIATGKVEDLIQELQGEFSILIVTHNMQQASRVSDYTAFMLAEEDRIGRLVEFAPTARIFTNPSERRTEDYITGRFG